MKTRAWSMWVLFGLLGSALACGAGTPHGAITHAADALWLVQLGGRELQRYVYLRCGAVWPLDVAGADADTPIVIHIESDETRPADAADYEITVRDVDRRRLIDVVGRTPRDALYGAYRLAYHMGVRFGLDGDVLPDAPFAFETLTAGVLERGKPLFATRGILPFHDFPEGPDWWNVDDYRAVLEQLPKLRMNFIGLHTYPEGGPNAEPGVWIGPRRAIGEGTAVTSGYPSAWFTTQRSGWNWGYGQKTTSEYLFGAAQLFDCDCFGADVMRDCCPEPKSDADSNALFGRAGDLLRTAFAYAHQRGILTCIGTETPLTVPAALRERLAAEGLAADDPNVVVELYRGIFRRAAQAHPLDYYWLWTPEGWTWAGASGEDVQKTLHDVEAALTAYAAEKPGFTLATCGWVLGPQDDRTLFDRLLPRAMPMSCINRQVGHAPVPRDFGDIQDRPLWAIPWLEDDQALTTPQLWVGRMRRDAVDARRYGCSGLMGIHWRTRVLAPNVAALAEAAWDQTGFAAERAGSGALDGSVAQFGGREIAGTDDDVPYQSVRWGLTQYRIAVPAGDDYTVVLHFSESHFAEIGQRVFDVYVQGQKVLDTFDVIKEVGRDAACVKRFEHVAAPYGVIDIDFRSVTENPLIAALEVIAPDGDGVRINCGGAAYKGFEADRVGEFRFVAAADFYADWCRAQFGPGIAAEAAALFTKLDGHLPRPAGWYGGPGGFGADGRPWAEAAKEYAFVDELAALRPRVRGAGCLARFDYWVNELAYLRSLGHVRCTWGVVRAALDAAEKETDDATRAPLVEKAQSAWRAHLDALAELHAHLFATATTMGTLGTVVNWQQHLLPSVVGETQQRLEKLCGGPLPAALQPTQAYRGPLRVSVPTVRTQLSEGEALELRVLVLSEAPPASATLHLRAAGAAEWRELPLTHVERGVYRATIPAIRNAGGLLEYYVAVRDAAGMAAMFPATAPERGQTLVVLP